MVREYWIVTQVLAFLILVIWQISTWLLQATLLIKEIWVKSSSSNSRRLLEDLVEIWIEIKTITIMDSSSKATKIKITITSLLYTVEKLIKIIIRKTTTEII